MKGGAKIFTHNSIVPTTWLRYEEDEVSDGERVSVCGSERG